MERKQLQQNSAIDCLEQQFIFELKGIVASAREYAYKSANVAQVVSNWLLGKRIVEQEKGNNSRADYGKHIVKFGNWSVGG